ncbi:unnamed protein product [Vitrella brassicaformis CCMP3155]|uniref:BioF2-like acetyltransferase domain-containing protein n=1 Tax=Vitrella brassicaformis (strain CCMP3155) TaxID=1169540 RepID=A0A0G4F6M4_VITBC|nr:unnamed protein product [Vitrella brassicaformis CCMP3155]|eukprot:CEM07672.1 unnamed protein product [Vitrella brassicaformis CCMP3155]
MAVHEQQSASRPRPRRHQPPAFFNLLQPSARPGIKRSLQTYSVEDSRKNRYRFQVHTKIADIKKEVWDRCVSETDSPFVEYDWLYSLEESNCACEGTGWAPFHLTVHEEEAPDDDILAVVPLYIKTHSNGEYIFDHSWADFSYSNGIPYFPKLLCAVPFTPAGGARILIRPSYTDERNFLRRIIASFMRKLAEDSNISSVHVNFCTQEEGESLEAVGYMPRKSTQFHWRNYNKDTGQRYTSFDEYLSMFKGKRRGAIKRERRAVYEKEGCELVVLRGDDITPALYRTAFELYKTTIDKLIWGRQYLSVRFFELLQETGWGRRNLCLILAKKDGRIVAGTINVVKAGHFYGRYWGAFEFVKNLHFETCYYKSVEYCIQEGIDAMQPGAGGGDFKFMRGYDPAICHSSHFIVRPELRRAIRAFLEMERDRVQMVADELNEKTKVRGADRSQTAAQAAVTDDQEEERDGYEKKGSEAGREGREGRREET